MKYEDISPAMREFMGYYEALRRLGFPSGSIYCLINMSASAGALAVFTHLEYAGREFNVECGPIDSKEQALTEYKIICDAHAADSISLEDQKRIWTESLAYKQAGALAVALLLKGIELPGASESAAPRTLN